jgi:predicted RNA-binding protein with RPS1 domain
MKFFKVLISKFSLLSAILLFGNVLYAQLPSAPQVQEQKAQFTNAEIVSFVETIKRVIPVQQETQQKMINKIDENGMTVEKFNELASKIQMQGSTDDLPEKEVEKFEKINTDLETIQKESESTINNAIEKNGMTMEQYQQMVMAYQSNPELKQKVDEMLQQGTN